jgi:hypothetical protein
MKPFNKTFPLYTLIFPALTVLMLTANNMGQLQLSVIWRTLLLSSVAGMVFLLIGWIIFKNITRAGLLAFPLLFFSLTYGHFFNIMRGRVIGTWVIGTHLYMLILWGLLCLGATYLLVFRLKNIQVATQILNLVILALAGFQLVRIAIYSVQERIAHAQTGETTPDTFLQPADPDQLPDVYFILLDKYARSDALMNTYDYDNGTFIEGLEDLGFWVADCSRSNYAFTVMSLSSELNMAYIEDLTDNPSLKTTTALIQNNAVHQAFEEIGYTTIAFDMGFSWGNMKDSDHYYESYPEDIESWNLDPFEIMYLKSTLGTLIFDARSGLGQQVTLSDLEQKAERTRLILNVLPEIPQMPEPKFVHAHIINPHPPYVFNADGSLNPDAEDTPDSEGYPTQLEYLEPRVLAAVTEIIETSEQPPIIIIEGDHAFGKKYVTSNLLALYLPGYDTDTLDGHMTLVNVFPLIFNTYFGTEIEALPDISYTHTKDWYESVPLEEWNPACIVE